MRKPKCKYNKKWNQQRSNNLPSVKKSANSATKENSEITLGAGEPLINTGVSLELLRAKLNAKLDVDTTSDSQKISDSCDDPTFEINDTNEETFPEINSFSHFINNTSPFSRQCKMVGGLNGLVLFMK